MFQVKKNFEARFMVQIGSSIKEHSHIWDGDSGNRQPDFITLIINLKPGDKVNTVCTVVLKTLHMAR